MLTPIEIQSKSFKSGIGYDRKDVDSFMREILLGYERLYKENVELKDKLNVLNDGIQYYKTIEKTLQKALVLAEQTAEETRQAALKSAKAIEKEARGKADLIIADAKNELNHINQMITGLTQQYECYKVQYRQLAAAQIDLLKSPTFELTLMNGEQLKTKEWVATTNNTDQSMDNSSEELEAFEKIVSYVSNEGNGNNNYGTNIEDSDFTMVEEAAISLDDPSKDNEEKKDTSTETEFEFIDFEVNLD